MRRRFGIDVVAAVVLPVACALALFLVRPDRDQPERGASVQTPLSTASVVCPSLLPGAADAFSVGSVGSDGELQVGLGATTGAVEVRDGRLAAVPSDGSPAVVTGTGDLAPGLVAGRAQTTPLAAVDCGPPVADQWFTGVGADATHASVIELVNPNAGPAIADITVRAPSGELDVPALRGVAVPGGSAIRLDLGQIVPRRGELALEVHTSRGRLAVHVVDSYDELGAGASAQDWLPSQPAPATTNVLLGLARGAGERTLVLANPGSDEVRAELQVLTPTSAFAPTGVEPIRVAPGATEAVSLDAVLAQAAKDGATGLLLESTGPVTATLRQVTGGDLSLLAAAPDLGAQGVAVVPPGAQQLLVHGPGDGAASGVRAYDARGRVTELSAAGAVDLPEGTVLVVLTPPPGPPARASVLLSGAGTAVVPLRPLVTTGLVPDVRPGVP